MRPKAAACARRSVGISGCGGPVKFSRSISYSIDRPAQKVAHTHHRHPGPDCALGQEADPATALEAAVAGGLRATLTMSAEPTTDSTVLTNPLLLEHDPRGLEVTLGNICGIDRDTTSCLLTDSALESARSRGHHADRWIKD